MDSPPRSKPPQPFSSPQIVLKQSHEKIREVTKRYISVFLTKNFEQKNYNEFFGKSGREVTEKSVGIAKSIFWSGFFCKFRCFLPKPLKNIQYHVVIVINLDPFITRDTPMTRTFCWIVTMLSTFGLFTFTSIAGDVCFQIFPVFSFGHQIRKD